MSDVGATASMWRAWSGRAAAVWRRCVALNTHPRSFPFQTYILISVQVKKFLHSVKAGQQRHAANFKSHDHFSTCTTDLECFSYFMEVWIYILNISLEGCSIKHSEQEQCCCMLAFVVKGGFKKKGLRHIDRSLQQHSARLNAVDPYFFHAHQMHQKTN